LTLLGIDIGGTAVKAAEIGPHDAPRIAVSDTYARPDRAQLRSAIAQAIERLGTNGAVSSGVRAVGLCVPGRRNAERNAVELAVNVPGLEGYRFDDIVRDALGRDLPCRVMTDAEAGTLDAARAHPGARRVLGIAIGTGVGCCLLESGSAQRIGSGSIGHLGQVDIGPIALVDPTGASAGWWRPIGSDGGRCSAEAFLGVPAWRERFGDDFTVRLADLTADDPALVALARLIRIGLAVYTPDLVLLIGGLAMAIEHQSAAIGHLVRSELSGVAPAGWRLAFGGSRHHAALGAASGAAVLVATPEAE
jgi:predicted NBD/HSP70 family sugar kinase